ncbi:MAG: CPBP family intramembrane metalloprotease [Anaerolineae bacterium]|nr:CPBP family intramembrane metalloprotease [Anaerolineae bacterium]
MAFQITLLLLTTAAFCAAAIQARRSHAGAGQHRLFLLLWGLILLSFVGYEALNVLSVLNILNADPALAAEMGLDAGTSGRAVLTLALSSVAAVGLWLLVASVPVRQRLSALFPAPRPEPLPDRGWPIPWEEQVRGFDPQSPMQAFALGAGLLLFLQTLLDYLIVGGQTGLASEGSLDELSLLVSSALTALMLIGVTLAGTGLGTDRSWPAVRQRLGLRLPNLSELVMGVGVAGAMIAFQFGAALLWVLFTSEADVAQQTQVSRAIAGSVTTFGAAFLVALFSSLGEEISFRGGLQPVFGLWPTTLLFALTHIQYQFTVAALIIFVVGLVFGLTRRHFGTSAAIVAHFCYNFGLLALSVMAMEMQSLF